MPATIQPMDAKFQQDALRRGMLPAGSSITLKPRNGYGQIVALNTAAGSTVILPKATGSGRVFRCLVTVTATSNSHVMKVGNATDEFRGFVVQDASEATAPNIWWAADDDDTITLNRSTTGLAAQGEYLLALKTRGELARAGGRAASDGDALVQAARRKLSLWDVPEAEIDRIARTGEPTKTLTFYSPLAGVVTKKDVVEGMKLDAGAMPYEIVDLSSVWVLADIYESELRFVHEGMGATLRLNAFPNREFKGQVMFIDPLLDPATRTVKVRLTFENRGGSCGRRCSARWCCMARRTRGCGCRWTR